MSLALFGSLVVDTRDGRNFTSRAKSIEPRPETSDSLWLLAATSRLGIRSKLGALVARSQTTCGIQKKIHERGMIIT